MLQSVKADKIATADKIKILAGKVTGPLKGGGGGQSGGRTVVEIEEELINAKELAKLGDVEQNKYILTRSSVIDLTSTSDKYKKDVSSLPLYDVSESQQEMEYNYLVNNTMADKEIILKKGSQVMCVVNIDMESETPIVNGSQGVVVEFIGGLPVVQFNNGGKRLIAYHNWISENVPSVGVKQIPLIHAWAITIHKAQGVSLDLAQIDAGSNIFECGQTYVALSRIKSMDGLYLTAFDPQKIKVNKKVQDFYTGESPPSTPRGCPPSAPIKGLRV